MPEEKPVAVPTLVSLLICDQVIDDKLTNKKSAIGLFNTILVHQVPTRIHSMAVLASLTEIAGRTPVELRLVRDADNAVVLTTKGHIDAPNPLATIDLMFALQGIRLGAAGQYAFEIAVGGELLGRRRFQIAFRPPPGKGRRGAAPGGPPMSQ
jgi:hypothetical protein